MKNRVAGFTLVEIMVVVGIIGVLAAVVYANFNQGSAQARDAQRKGDLRAVQNALELYRQENGRYPEGCNGSNWSGESDYTYKCTDGGIDYIRGSASGSFAPKYIPVLPTDPKPGAANSDYGYVYRTNDTGTVYKLVARRSREGSAIASYYTDFAACDADDSLLFASTPITGLPREGSFGGNPAYAYSSCNRLSNNNGGWIALNASDCRLNNINTSLAVWGGYANPADFVTGTGIDTEEKKVEFLTEKVICDMP
jgi:prepilin-type N-terminal cleavage/methylation domain-containing protein